MLECLSLKPICRMNHACQHQLHSSFSISFHWVSWLTYLCRIFEIQPLEGFQTWTSFKVMPASKSDSGQDFSETPSKSLFGSGAIREWALRCFRSLFCFSLRSPQMEDFLIISWFHFSNAKLFLSANQPFFFLPEVLCLDRDETSHVSIQQ